MTAISHAVSSGTWWRELTRPRGDVVWDGMVRGTGVVGLAAIGAMALVPQTVPLVGFMVVTVWLNSPVGVFLPAVYEPVLMLFGRMYPPLLIGLLGTLGTVYVEYLNYRIHGRVLASKRLHGLTTGRTATLVTAWFKKAPFFTIWLVSISPLPYWLVRILSPLAGYPASKHLVATFLGRFPKLWFFAALGAAWTVDLGLLSVLLAVAVVAVYSVSFAAGKRRRGGRVVRQSGGRTVGRTDGQPV